MTAMVYRLTRTKTGVFPHEANHVINAHCKVQSESRKDNALRELDGYGTRPRLGQKQEKQRRGGVSLVC